MKLIVRGRIGLFIVLLASCCLAGCYTVLRHPTTGELAEESDFTRCSDCHDAGVYWPPDPIDPWYPPPWWWGPVVIVDGDRPIIQRQVGERGDWPVIKTKTPIGIAGPGGAALPQPPPVSTDGGEGGTTVKKEPAGSDQPDGSRPVHTREPEKGSGDAQQSGSKEKK